MTIKDMFAAAREGNPSDFEKAVGSVVAEKLSAALTHRRAEVAREMLGMQNESVEELSTEELTEQEIENFIATLSEEDLEYLDTLEEERLANMLESDIRRYTKSATKVGAVAGAVAGAVGGGTVGSTAVGTAVGAAAGAAGGAVAGTARKVVRKVANGVRKLRGKPVSHSPRA